MINFNEVYYKSVQKEEVAWTESLSTLLFDLPRAGFKDFSVIGKFICFEIILAIK